MYFNILKFHSIVWLMLSAGFMFAQSESLNYQTVLTDSEGDVILLETVDLKVEILQSSPTGVVVYEETHSTVNGLSGQIEIEIGAGSPQGSSYQDVDWSKINYIKVSYKPEGFPGFIEGEAIKLLSVPYALFTLNVTCDQGCPGADGFEGAQGLQGIQGAQGPQGQQGVQGVSGSIGKTGIQGLSGLESLLPTDMPPVNPSDGDFYLDTGSNRTDGNLGLRYFNNGQWTDF